MTITNSAHPYTRVFSALALGCCAAAWVGSAWWAKVLWVWGAISFGAVAVAYVRRRPGVFGKSKKGTVPVLTFLLFGPYLFLYMLLLVAFRLDRRHKPYTEIEDGVYLGCRLHSGDRARTDAHGIAAALDLTAELPGIGFWRTGDHYFNLPTLDATSPTLEQLRAGVRWLSAQRAADRAVYIHCAFGHGRSATLLAAYLIHTGRVTTPEEAYHLLKTKRPGVKFSSEQWRVLREFAADPNAADNAVEK